MKPFRKDVWLDESSPLICSGVPRWKRVLDVTCILLALPMLVFLGLFIAIGIKILSRGPVLFKQERVGFRGKRFNCLKFRTMTMDADTSVHQTHLSKLINSNLPMVKLDLEGDARVIPLGWLIRSTGLDELPQVINVLRGEMSLVGPRPCLPYEHESYQPRHKERCETLPGLTGLWQVTGKNNTTFEEMMDLDIWYARNKSLWLDLEIIFKTIPAVFMLGQEMRRIVKRNQQRHFFSPLPARPVHQSSSSEQLFRANDRNR